MTRGTLIVLEGLDRAGKSSQCLRLVDHLRNEGQNVKHVRFPDRTTPIGIMIDNYLKGTSQQEDHVIHLLFSANRWEVAASIEESIHNGIDVVVDRYIYSGCVYSAAKHNPSLDLAWARHPEVGLPRPDVCVFLDLSPAEAATRGGWGGERYEKSELQDRVRNLFDTIKASPDGDEFITVDAGRSIDEVATDIWKVVSSVRQKVQQGNLPLRKVTEV